MIDEEKLLLDRLHKGDISALEALYTRYAPEVMHTVSSIVRTPEDADDIVQDIFIKIWEERETVSSVADFKPYLLAMTRNMTYNRLKHGHVHNRYMDWLSRRPYVYDPENRIIEKDLLKNISNEMDRLTAQQRMIFEMNRNGDLTYNEIAAKLGISPKTVQYHIGKVLARLKKITSL